MGSFGKWDAGRALVEKKSLARHVLRGKAWAEKDLRCGGVRKPGTKR